MVKANVGIIGLHVVKAITGAAQVDGSAFVVFGGRKQSWIHTGRLAKSSGIHSVLFYSCASNAYRSEDEEMEGVLVLQTHFSAASTSPTSFDQAARWNTASGKNNMYTPT